MKNSFLYGAFPWLPPKAREIWLRRLLGFAVRTETNRIRLIGYSDGEMRFRRLHLHNLHFLGQTCNGNKTPILAKRQLKRENRRLEFLHYLALCISKLDCSPDGERRTRSIVDR